MPFKSRGSGNCASPCIAVSLVNDSTSALSVKYRGVSRYYVCSDQWTSAFSDAVCRQLGYTSVCLCFYLHTQCSKNLFVL